MESSDQFICFFCGSLSDEYGCSCSTCELCGNDAHNGYDCPSQVPFVYNQDPCLNQNLDNFSQTSPSFPQQYLCCEDCGGPHATFECQPMNQNFYEPNFCYNSNSSGVDQFQPPQESIDETPLSDAITPDLPITNSLVMEDEHLDTIPETDSVEEIESSVENLNLTLRSLLNKDTVITSPKIDFHLEEFAEIRLIKKLLYDNSSPRPPKELNSENDFEKENSGSTTIHTNISFPEYESFNDESDSASEIFNDDLTHIISPSEYEYVYADDESDSGDSTRKLQMSHRGFKALKISHNFFNKSPMMIYGGDMPILDVSYLHFYPP
ncbi:hypothetical protein Tco_0195413 [Tanacetum coccineum]